MVELLFKQLLNRGYKANDITPVFTFKINAKDCRSFQPSTSSSASRFYLDEKRVFFTMNIVGN